MAEDRTATGVSPSADHASVISRAMASGIGRAVSSARMPAASAAAASARTSASTPSTNARYAAVVSTKPGGTGSPARVSSPRLAPLPPATATSPRPSSAKRTTYDMTSSPA